MNTEIKNNLELIIHNSALDIAAWLKEIQR